MSGHRAARKLRASGSNGNSGGGSMTRAALLLAEGESDFRAHMAVFKGSSRASKVATALQSHRRTWIAESKQMNKNRRILEGEIQAVWMNMNTMATAGGEATVGVDATSILTVLREAAAERTQLAEETRRYAADMNAQTRRAKATLRAMRVQRRAQQAEEQSAQQSIAPTPTPALRRKSGVATSSLTAATAAAAATSNSAAASSAGVTVDAATADASRRRAEPLSNLISSLSAQFTQRWTLLVQEEQELRDTLQPLLESLERFESSPDDEFALSATESMQHDQKEPPLEDDNEAEQRACEADEEVEEEEAQEECLLEELPMPEDGEETDTVAVAIEPQRAFLARTLPLIPPSPSSSSSLLQSRSSATTSASARRLNSNKLPPSSARSSLRGDSISVVGAPSWPPLPSPDPALSATLPDSWLQEHYMARDTKWTQARLDALDAFQLHANQLERMREVFWQDTMTARAAIQEADKVLAQASSKSTPGSGSGSSSGGCSFAWGPEQQSRLKLLESSYRTHGQTHAQLMDRLRIEFTKEIKLIATMTRRRTTSSSNNSTMKSSKLPPPPSPTTVTTATASGLTIGLCLAERVDLLERTRTLSVQRSALIQSFTTEHATRISEAMVGLQELDHEALASFHHAQTLRDQTESQQSLHAELEILRADRSQRDRIEEAKRRASQLLQDAERATKEEREAFVREQQKKLLTLYQSHLAAEAAEAQEATERARAQAAENARAEIEARKPLVERRQDLIIARRAALAERDSQASAALLARESRLDAIRALVVTSAERDPTRLLAATAASSAEDLSANPLFAVHGYDMSSLLKDKRFRIQLALWNAGMHQTEYGKQVVQMARPAQQPRRDMESTVFPARPT